MFVCPHTIILCCMLECGGIVFMCPSQDVGDMIVMVVYKHSEFMCLCFTHTVHS